MLIINKTYYFPIFVIVVITLMRPFLIFAQPLDTEDSASIEDQLVAKLSAIWDMLLKIPDILSQSFQENTISWLIVSAIIAGSISAIIKYITEQYIPQQRLKKATRNAIQKYSYPLQSAIFELSYKIDDLLLNRKEAIFNDPKDNFYRLSILYFFGRYFGWSRLLEKEAFLEYSERKEMIRSKKIQKFNFRSYMTFKALSSPQYFEGHVDFDNDGSKEEMYKKGDYSSNISLDKQTPPLVNVESATVDRLVLTAIGDLMIKENNETKETLDNIISFVDFARNYENCKDFKKWFLLYCDRTY